MKKLFLTLCCLASLAALPVLLTGCDDAHAAATIGKRDPPLGRDCIVQFRRDFLGTARDIPVSPTLGSINGAETCVRGKLVVVTDEWIVLSYTVPVAAKPIEREFWIPRSVVLLLEMSPR